MDTVKTLQNDQSVDMFLYSINDSKKSQDANKIIELMKQATSEVPKMWGNSIIGFGNYHYKYESGREGDTFVIGFSPRKQNLTLYFMTYVEQYQDLMQKLGKYKAGKGCLYINKREDINVSVLDKLIKKSVGDLISKKNGLA